MALRMTSQAAALGQPWNATAWALAKAEQASEFQLSTAPLPVTPQGDYLALTDATLAKYSPWFAPYC